jgi:hypothetical protein
VLHIQFGSVVECVQLISGRLVCHSEECIETRTVTVAERLPLGEGAPSTRLANRLATYREGMRGFL